VKASQMLILTNMLAKIISEVDDLRQMINDMKMKEMESQGFMEEE
jgi:hypothetical protein